MEPQELDLLEEYIAAENKKARKNAQLTELCDVIDEIRLLYPPLPGPDFVERTVERIAEKISARQPRRRFYHTWFKRAGWTSAAVAAVLLVILGVMPTKPAEHLPPLPAPPVPSEYLPEKISPEVTAPHNTSDKQQNLISAPDNNMPSPAGQKNEIQTFTARNDTPNAYVVAAEEKENKANKENMKGGVSAPQERPQTLPVVNKSAADMEKKVPFEIMTIPERTPVQFRVTENPPEVIIIYKIDGHEIAVRQWIPDTTGESHPVPASPDQTLRLQRGDVAVEISGSADRAVLEEVARNLR